MEKRRRTVDDLVTPENIGWLVGSRTTKRIDAAGRLA